MVRENQAAHKNTLTTLSSFWLSEASRLHSMSRGPESSGARENWQSSFTLCPLAFSMDVGPEDVISRPWATPDNRGRERGRALTYCTTHKPHHIHIMSIATTRNL